MSLPENPFNLIESMALVPVTCANCLDEIEIGDDCWVDTLLGTEEKQAKTYCANCVDL